MFSAHISEAVDMCRWAITHDPTLTAAALNRSSYGDLAHGTVQQPITQEEAPVCRSVVEAKTLYRPIRCPEPCA